MLSKISNISMAVLWVTAFFFVGCDDSDDGQAGGEDDMAIRTTPAGVQYVRTPESKVDGLPDWDFQYRYLEIDGLRQAYVDEGPRDGEPILLLHGQPSWSYLYRHMIPPLVEKGYRVVAMDHLGMGMSDKPIDTDYYRFDIHLGRLRTFVDQLGLRNTTVFLQDWGSVIGLYAAGTDLGLFGRIILGNGGLPIVEQPYKIPDDLAASNQAYHEMLNMIPDEQTPFFDENGNSLLPINDGSPDAGGFGQWMGYALYYEDFRTAKVVEALTYDKLSEAEEAAYDAPYPARVAMAGPRSFPSLLNDLVGRTADKEEALREYDKPFLTIFGQNDPGLAGDSTQAWMIKNVPGADGQAHHLFPDASHFLQDDKGAEIANMVDAFIKDNP